MQLFDLLDNRRKFFLFGLVDHIGVILANHRHVCRKDKNLQLVYLAKFFRLGIGRTGHPRQFFIHPEIILKGDRRQGLIFLLDLDPLLRLEGLMETIAVTPSRHDPAGKFIHDDDLSLLDEVVDIPFEEGVGAKGLVNMMEEINVLGFIEILDFEITLDPGDPLLRQNDRTALLLDGIILFLAKVRDHLVDPVVLVGRLIGRSGDDQRRPRLIDEDAVHLVHDGIVEIALHILIEGELHVVAEIVESELVVCPVGDVGMIGSAPLVIIHPVNDDADTHAEKIVDRAHPRGIPLGQIVIDRHKMDALSGQRVQIEGHRRGQGLPLACFHLGDLPLVQNQSPEDLNVKGSHLNRPLRRFADDGKGLDEDVVQPGSVLQLVTEIKGFGLEFVIGRRRHGRLKLIDLMKNQGEAFHLPFVFASKNLPEN